nr:hypothetical protein [Spiractinospora alimapuensis]
MSRRAAVPLGVAAPHNGRRRVAGAAGGHREQGGQPPSGDRQVLPARAGEAIAQLTSVASELEQLVIGSLGGGVGVVIDEVMQRVDRVGGVGLADHVQRGDRPGRRRGGREGIRRVAIEKTGQLVEGNAQLGREPRPHPRPWRSRPALPARDGARLDAESAREGLLGVAVPIARSSESAAAVRHVALPGVRGLCARCYRAAPSSCLVNAQAMLWPGASSRGSLG